MTTARPRILPRILFTLAALLITPTLALAAGEGWSHDVEASLAKAKAEGKHVIMDFTGSDWCGWCIRLNKEVFSHDEFKSQVPNDFVLVELDFPRDKSKLTAETIAQNKMWQEKLGIRGFPSIVLLTADGSAYAKTGYRPGGPDAYVKHLAELKASKTAGDELRAKADAAEGIEQAKLYDQLLDMADAGLMLEDADALMTKIIEADADGKAGLKDKYLGKQTMTKVEALMQQGPAKLDETLAFIDKAFAEQKPAGTFAQDLHMMKAQLLMHKKNVEAAAAKSATDKKLAEQHTAASADYHKQAAAEVNAALAAAPDSEAAAHIKQIKQRFFADVE